MSINKVRLLIPDLDPDDLVFTNEQITEFLDMEGTVKRAAAQALDTIASNEAMVSKQIRTNNLQTNGPAVAAELRSRARALRGQDATEQAGEAEFGIITGNGQVI
ncbi:MAG: hypothetical protein WAS05_00205 [Candidatus Nanopelagicales bacterium]